MGNRTVIILKITEKKVVSITYSLTANDQHIETVDASHPMLFLHGNSGLPEKFEDNLVGLSKGDDFHFTLLPSDAFGTREEEDIVDLPIENFYSEDGKLDSEFLAVGKIIPLTDEQNNHHKAIILEINESEKFIKLDFNHPLADKTLHFTGKIIEVREATKEELDHGHAHGLGGHNH